MVKIGASFPRNFQENILFIFLYELTLSIFTKSLFLEISRDLFHMRMVCCVLLYKCPSKFLGTID